MAIVYLLVITIPPPPYNTKLDIIYKNSCSLEKTLILKITVFS